MVESLVWGNSDEYSTTYVHIKKYGKLYIKNLCYMSLTGAWGNQYENSLISIVIGIRKTCNEIYAFLPTIILFWSDAIDSEWGKLMLQVRKCNGLIEG